MRPKTALIIASILGIGTFLVGFQDGSVARASDDANKTSSQSAHGAYTLEQKYRIMKAAFGSTSSTKSIATRTAYVPPVIATVQPRAKTIATSYVQRPSVTTTSNARSEVVYAAQPSYDVRLARLVSQPTVKPSPRVKTYLPAIDKPDILEKHKDIADEVLRQFPAACREALKNFYVRYDNPEHRGLGGKNSIILTGNVPDDEFRALMVHELGHVFDLNPNPGCLGGNPSSGESEFRDGSDIVYNDDPSLEFYRISWTSSKVRKSESKDDDFASGYASWDVFEDFAESFALYVLQNDVFRERAATNPVMAAKYRWFQTHMFDGDPGIATGNHVWKGTVPWDVTKLPYDWHPRFRAASL